MNRKMSNRSSFYPIDLQSEIVYHSDIRYDFHSQLGSSYQLANLGNIKEHLDRFTNYDRSDLPIKRDLARMAINHFFKHITKTDPIPPLAAYAELNKNSSIGTGAKALGILNRLDDDLIEYLNRYINGDIWNCYIVASQKDELRVSGKTPRLFMSYPVEHTFAATITMKNFCSQFYKNGILSGKTCSSVGDAPQHGAFATYKHLLEQFPFKYATDTKSQDSSVSTEFINLVYDKIKEKINLNSTFEHYFELVRYNSINKLTLLNGHLFMLKRGLASGDYLTLIINIIWRLYMVLDNYNHDIKTFWDDNFVIICGDDLVMSSKFSDLNLSSRHATIEWAGKPISNDLLDFCSVKFYPSIHHSSDKILSVLALRRKTLYSGVPSLEMQRLGGLLRVLSDKNCYDKILIEMKKLMLLFPHTEIEFYNQYVDYSQMFNSYNYLQPFLPSIRSF